MRLEGGGGSSRSGGASSFASAFASKKPKPKPKPSGSGGSGSVRVPWAPDILARSAETPSPESPKLATETLIEQISSSALAGPQFDPLAGAKKTAKEDEEDEGETSEARRKIDTSGMPDWMRNIFGGSGGGSGRADGPGAVSQGSPTRGGPPARALDEGLLGGAQAPSPAAGARAGNPQPRARETGEEQIARLLKGNKVEGAEADTWKQGLMHGLVKSDGPDAMRPDATPEERAKAKTREITPERYEDMSPLQQAAVNYNTMLSQMSERDRKNWNRKLTKDYFPTLKKVLGDEKSADPIGLNEKPARRAPEVLAMLEQMKFKDDNDFTEIDEFLSMANGISFRDLNNYLDDEKPDLFLEKLSRVDGVETRSDLVKTLAERTEELKAALRKDGPYLQDLPTTAYYARENDRLELGASPKDPLEIATGFGKGPGGPNSTDPDDEFRAAFDVLAAAKPKDFQTWLADWYSYMDESGLDRNDFFRYADTRLDQTKEFKLPIGVDKKLDYQYTPDEFRERLGLAPRRKRRYGQDEE